jgi:hypothetical protein
LYFFWPEIGQYGKKKTQRFQEIYLPSGLNDPNKVRAPKNDFLLRDVACLNAFFITKQCLFVALWAKILKNCPLFLSFQVNFKGKI